MAYIEIQQYECTPSSLLDSTPCLKCLSEKELLAVLVGIFAASADKTVAQVMEDSACFTCLSKKEMLQALVTIMGNAMLGEGTTPSDIIANYHCLVCAPEQQLLAAALQLLCNFTITIRGQQLL